MLGEEASSKPIKDLKIDGTLRARKPVNFFKHFDETFVVFEAVGEGDNEALRIRGFKPTSTTA